ncbi:helix-turn-helix transcriptional regulator [Martelella lutilitoris]|uniref:Helix-turn-helix transcriptional regulator n=1 Tax=Martelella lutilitoris TaxID=2583532 RepID=A0A5C4JTG9_9HYPH|nr:helix-turn-helix transcriptional regulator [Martelella lutilitoris]TNB48542.1 helix-turn-helix transcriptional regulator [Martelella lutilitoris]
MRVPPGQAEILLGDAIAALHSEGFAPSLAAWLRLALAFDNITILAYADGSPPTGLYTEAREKSVHAGFDTVYRAGSYLLDPFYALHARRAPDGLYRLSDIAPDQFSRSDYYMTYYRATTLVDEIAFVAAPASDVSLHICLGRDATSGRRFSTATLARARQVAPVVNALSTRNWSEIRAAGSAPSEEDVLAALFCGMQESHGVTLTRRQTEVALLILKGHSSLSIAARLGLSTHTVKVFRRQLYQRCGISSQAELFALMMPILAALPNPERLRARIDG